MAGPTFIPAARFHVLTPLFDAGAEVFGLGRRFKHRLVASMAFPRGARVLDVGSGTGLFAVLLAGERPDLVVHAVDVDPAILRIARRRGMRAGVGVWFHRAAAQALPFGDATFDVVTSTLTVHHLPRSEKRRAMAEVARVLKPGGAFYPADFAPPRTPLARAVTWHLRLVGFEHTREHFAGEIRGLLLEAGLMPVAEHWQNAWAVSLVEARQAAHQGGQAESGFSSSLDVGRVNPTPAGSRGSGFCNGGAGAPEQAPD